MGYKIKNIMAKELLEPSDLNNHEEQLIEFTFPNGETNPEEDYRVLDDDLNEDPNEIINEDTVNEDLNEDPINEDPNEVINEDLNDDGNKSEVNAFEILANVWKSDGIIPEDYEIKPDITNEDLEKIYRDLREEPLKNEIRSKIIEEEGLDEKTLKIAKQLANGVKEEQIEKEKVYKVLANAKLSPEDDTYENDIAYFLNYYYADLGLPQNLIQRNIERDLEDIEGIDDVLETARKHFVDSAVKIETNNNNIALANEKARIDREKEEADKLTNLIQKGELKGVKYSKQDMEVVKKALFSKTELVKDKDGNYHKVTAYDKKRLEVANDFEANLKQIVDFILGRDSKVEQQELEETTRVKLLEDLRHAASGQKPISGISKNKPKGSDNISSYGDKKPLFEIQI